MKMIPINKLHQILVTFVSGPNINNGITHTRRCLICGTDNFEITCRQLIDVLHSAPLHLCPHKVCNAESNILDHSHCCLLHLLLLTVFVNTGLDENA